jgi:hypothetical protein
MLEGRRGPTGTAVFGSAVAEGAPFPKEPAKSSVGGTPGWSSSSARWYGWPGLDRSFRRDFRPDRSPASRGSGVAKLVKPTHGQIVVPFRRVHRHACVACRGPLDLVLSPCSKGTRSQEGEPQVCRGVVRACSQPQEESVREGERERERERGTMQPLTNISLASLHISLHTLADRRHSLTALRSRPPQRVAPQT